MRIRPLAIGLAVLLNVVLPASGHSAEQVLTDPASGCRVRDPVPVGRKAIRWTGACRNGFAHGPGVLEWTLDGRPGGSVEASFVQGRAEGAARLEWEDGRSYTGPLRHGLPSGAGVLTLPEGHRYVGTFAGGRPTGQGMFISSMGARYRARVDDDGEVWPGAMLGSDPSGAIQSAERPPSPGRAAPGSLEEWLRQPAPPDTQ